MKLRQFPRRLLAFCVVTLLIAALAPLVLIGGEAVNRHYLGRLRTGRRGRIMPRIGYFPGTPWGRRRRWGAVVEPPRHLHAEAACRGHRLGGLARPFLTNPLWIVLTAPARWVADRLRPLAGGRRRRGNGPPGAGVREPRRPRPDLPAGAMALPDPHSFR